MRRSTEHLPVLIVGAGPTSKVAHISLERMGQGLSPFPFALTCPQDVHERLLIDRLDALGVRVERQTSLVRFEQHPDSVRAVLEMPNGSEDVCEATYLAGCDGAHSTVREMLASDFPGGTYSGLFYVADVNASGPAVDGDIHVDLEEADFLAVFPLKGAGSLRLIGPSPGNPMSSTGSLTSTTLRDARPRT